MSAPVEPTAPPRRKPGRPPRTAEGASPRPRPPRAKQTPRSIRIVGKKASPEARRLAAAVLEVLGGARTTSDAAKALGCSLPRYYQLEARAVEGLLVACEPARRGPGLSPARELEAAKKRCARLEREVSRQQALTRIAQRTIGLPAPAPEAKPKAGKRRAHRPRARALVAVAALREPSAAARPSAPVVNVPPAGPPPMA